ncbi:interleukin-31 receptor subunit alpha isoform X2 [Microcaecilia unicolor]|uniref:Interleukin-31 receptor subunit alpha isoform X2 n=1 Tax=Microcaecilia unicolor TaxID=1415580 RepID=A0A6P7X931_9AMPH|nr:interleukin-31 receptor subunit alpha isoform X2 [Microcaecilia unicolor]
MMFFILWISTILCRSHSEERNQQGYSQIIPQNPVIVQGSNITLACVLGKSELSYTNASYIFWKLDEDLIPEEFYTTVNTTVSYVTILNFTAQRRHVRCYIHALKHHQLLQQTELTSGTPPGKPKNISCIYYDQKNFTCTWLPGRDTHLQTNYSLVARRSSDEIICHSSTSSCFFCYPNITFNSEYKIEVIAKNIVGEAQSDLVKMHTLELVKTAPPELVSVEPIQGKKQMLTVIWERPLLAPNSLSVNCSLRYKAVNSTRVLLNHIYMGKEKQMVHNLTGLLNFTEYAISMRCIGTDGPILWSEWSAEKTGRTEEQAPSRKVDLWRVIGYQPGGKRFLHLMWKEFVEVPPSGIILGYRIGYFLEANASLTRTYNTTNREVVLNLTGDAYIFSVIAYNSAGHSPEATLRIPAVDEKLQDFVYGVQAVNLKEQMVVTWMSLNPAVFRYVVEWCVVSDTNVSWQHVSYSTNWTAPTGAFEPFKCYNISVYPLFGAEVGQPYSIQAYFKEGRPLHGPSAKTENLGKNEVTIKWEDISKDKRNGFITNYTIFYKAINGKEQDSVYITSLILPIGLCMAFVILLGVICIRKRRKFKQFCWPDVPNPSDSSMAEWSKEKPKLNSLMNGMQSDGMFAANINVLPSFSSCEDHIHLLGVSEEIHMENTSIGQEPTPPSPQSFLYCKEQEFAQTLTPPAVLYLTAQQNYKSHAPSTFTSNESLSFEHKSSLPSKEAGHEFRPLLLQDACSKGDGNRDILEDEGFQQEVAVNPYLKNSSRTREFLVPDNCSAHIREGTQQPSVIVTPCQQNVAGQTYVTVHMVGLPN